MLLALTVAALPQLLLAQRDSTREGLARLEETLQMRVEDGGLQLKDLVPAMVVSVAPLVEDSRTWYPAAALNSLAHVFGAGALRSCEACMAPRLYVQEGWLEQRTTGLTTAEIVKMDEDNRGAAPPARTAIWLDETKTGVSIRIVDLRNSRIVLADNFDPEMLEPARTRRAFTLARELERRSRGDAITHTFFDVALYPGQHVSFDIAEQWGEDNANLSGISFSLYDPVVGVGVGYYRVIPRALNVMVGAKVLVSIPTAIINAFSPGSEFQGLDPLLTAVLIVRFPIASSNYAVDFSASTAGRIGFGFSLMNISLLPFLP